MTCPNCNREIERGVAVCPHCGFEPKTRAFRPLRAVIVVLSWILALAIIFVGVYKLYYWIDSYKLNKLYTRGAYTPSVTEITLDDGRAGHAITYYGQDGDAVFFEDLDRTVAFSGGVARLEIADSDWFGTDIESIESANVSVAAILIRQNGDKRILPALTFDVVAPESPITVISPESDDLAVNTSLYPLEVQVVPGSKVSVNGKDATDIVDQAGKLSYNVDVYPIGDNTYTLIVNTPGHKEARRDILIYRAQMEIGVELSTGTLTTTSTNIVTISGKCDPGAMISVDTDYVEGSVTNNLSTGEFSFIAKLTTYGKNTVRFRATMEGKADSVISLNITYKPTIDEYSRKAWKIEDNYTTLCELFEQWTGRIFKCTGEVVDVVYEDEVQYVIIDVGTDGTQQLLVLENQSSLGSPTRGKVYVAYADVSGRHMYNTHYYPMLIARFLDLKTD